VIGTIGIVVLVLGYALASRWLSKTPVTGPMVFVLAGVLLGPGVFDIVKIEVSSELIQVLLEGTLIVVLFTDSAVIDIAAVRRHLTLPGRLLSVGMILTIAAGVLLADAMFGELGFWGAAVVAITLAPTDAALGQAVVTNRAVPGPIRQGLSVESGLNDGIAVPLLAVALAGTIGELQTVGEFLVVFAQQLGFAVLVGVAIGYLGAKLMVLCSERGFMSEEWRQIAVPTVAVLCYLAAAGLGGSGFIAAFVGGMVFGGHVRKPYPTVTRFSESLAYLMTMISFLVFGLVVLGPALSLLTWPIVIYAVLSLSVVRMVPVAISLIGAKLSFPTILYVGWFGPRGLASLVFAGTIVAETDPVANQLTLTIIAATVGLSVLLHGLTAWPLSRAYGRWASAMDVSKSEAGEMAPMAPVRVRMRVTEADKAGS
jgi:NhaP-type Na+/H+ or K+/H+ antiporter